MLPVVQELTAEKEAEQGRRAGRGEVEQAMLIGERERDRDDPSLDAANQILAERHAERRRALAPIVDVAMGQASEHVFQRHEAERCREHQDAKLAIEKER